VAYGRSILSALRHILNATGRTGRQFARRKKVKISDLQKIINEEKRAISANKKRYNRLKNKETRRAQELRREIEAGEEFISQSEEKLRKLEAGGDRFERFISHPYVLFGTAAAPGVGMVAREALRERRRGQEMKIRRIREERKRKELLQKAKELEQRKEREFRKRMENELRRESLLRREYPDFYPTPIIVKKKVGRPKKVGRKRVYYPVRRNNKTYYIRRGIRTKKT